MKDPWEPRTKYLSWSFIAVIIVVLIVTSKGLSYWRMIVKVSSISLSTPRRARRKPVTDFGRPKRTKAWSMVCVPSIYVSEDTKGS